MTKEDKDLLIKDLCARLPYGVWIEQKLKSCKFGSKCMLHAYDIDAIKREQYNFYKPYLFPLSSMTEEQKEEFRNKFDIDIDISKIFNGIDFCGSISFRTISEIIDWLNKNHFDYRYLIERGLALDATGLNIY